ncbi:uncharacterized protein LOC125941382 [Dermacentor silvarum]|uniref:uncharacterized protein LOC125941382 n=1 Tax=Dermacentor silvarum TaxID=543639 RepID=UPI0021008283|nr:uncharacterized protein LOC125941382 [Dermacentor silvarum]
MALAVWNPKMKLGLIQTLEMMTIRARLGDHHYYQGDGAPTTNGFLFCLVSHPLTGQPEIALVVEISPQWKTFEFNYKHDKLHHHLLYKYPKSPGSTEAEVKRQYNDQDHELDCPLSDTKLVPGVHILRLKIDDDTQTVQVYEAK